MTIMQGVEDTLTAIMMCLLATGETLLVFICVYMVWTGLQIKDNLHLKCIQSTTFFVLLLGIAPLAYVMWEVAVSYLPF